jgi:hypothetical protein
MLNYSLHVMLRRGRLGMSGEWIGRLLWPGLVVARVTSAVLPDRTWPENQRPRERT